MGVLTTLLKLLKPGENDYYNQQTEQADNWQKVDDYAVLTNADKNGIWGGEYGGKIQDPIPKELNKRYIDNINGKAFICIKAGDSSVTSNTTEYFTPCNTVDNLGKLQNLVTFPEIIPITACLPIFCYKIGNYLTGEVRIETGGSEVPANTVLFRFPFDVPTEVIRTSILISDGSPNVIEHANILNKGRDVIVQNRIGAVRRSSLNFTIKI